MDHDPFTQPDRLLDHRLCIGLETVNARLRIGSSLLFDLPSASLPGRSLPGRLDVEIRAGDWGLKPMILWFRLILRFSFAPG